MLLIALTSACQPVKNKGLTNEMKRNSVLAQGKCEPDFDTFFQKFSADSIFQKQHVDFPVIEYYSDEDFPLDIMERSIDEENYEFIDLSKDKAADKQEKDLYKVETEKQNDSVFYRQRGINNYIDITYKFARKDQCWWLVEIRDMTD